MYMGAFAKNEKADFVKKPTDVPTPHAVCEWIYNTVSPVIKPKFVLDPCAGDGRLTAPWRDADPLLIVKEFEIKRGPEGDFLASEPIPGIDLVLLNPPFNAGNGKPYAPMVFMQKVFEVAGPDVPVVLICPMGFRLNCTRKSKRLAWLETLNITSVVALPRDCFEGVDFQTEMIMFNVPGVKPHYICTH